MIARLLAIMMTFTFLIGWPGSSRKKFHSEKKNAVKPILHKGYYKKHLYKNHVWIGAYRTRWFEKQGVRKSTSPKF